MALPALVSYVTFLVTLFGSARRRGAHTSG
jgi:hypothetical protein